MLLLACVIPVLLVAVDPFEVASVKPNRSGAIGNTFRVAPNGDLTMTNVTLRDLVRTAYTLQEPQFAGGGNGETAPADPTRKTAFLRLQQLLAERFALQPHVEQRQLDGLALAVAAGGHKLQAAKATLALSSQGVRHERVRRCSRQHARTHRPRSYESRRAALGIRPEVEPRRDDGTPPTGDGPSIYSAIREQLGLKLEKRKLVVDVRIVDQASQPREN